MLMAGRHYLTAQGKTTAVPESQLVHAAVESLGLNDVSKFDPNERIVEYRLRESGDLVSMTVDGFTDELSIDSPAPGGGSVSALMGTLGAALVSMVAALTHGKKGMEDSREEMEFLGSQAQALKKRLTSLVDEDTAAFNDVMVAFRMKRKTDKQKAERDAAIQSATKNVTQIPLVVTQLCFEVLELSKTAIEKGNPNSVSDAGVAAEAALAGLRGARLNVLINLDDIGDGDYCAEMTEKVDNLLQKGKSLHSEVVAAVVQVMEGGNG
jgi:glutamate formiminotransferase/formiminotetrahydrofolate cyclodeaminase